MKMREVMNHPSRQKLRERHPSQRRMFSPPLQIFRLQIEFLQRSQILFPQASEFVEELFQRLVFNLFLREPVKGIKCPRFAMLQNDPNPWQPISALSDDQMAQDD